MLYLTHIPPPPLSHFIEWLFFYEGYAPPHTKEKRLPDGAVELPINLREEPKLLFGNCAEQRPPNSNEAGFPGSRSQFFTMLAGVFFSTLPITRFKQKLKA